MICWMFSVPLLLKCQEETMFDRQLTYKRFTFHTEHDWQDYFSLFVGCVTTSFFRSNSVTELSSQKLLRQRDFFSENSNKKLIHQTTLKSIRSCRNFVSKFGKSRETKWYIVVSSQRGNSYHIWFSQHEWFPWRLTLYNNISYHTTPIIECNDVNRKNNNTINERALFIFNNTSTCICKTKTKQKSCCHQQIRLKKYCASSCPPITPSYYKM